MPAKRSAVKGEINHHKDGSPAKAKAKAKKGKSS
jgi:hypothetical protein